MSYVILEDIVYTKPATQAVKKRLSCMCPNVKEKVTQIYDREGIQNKLDAAKIVREKLEAENAKIDENIRKHGEAAKAYFLAAK